MRWLDLSCSSCYRSWAFVGSIWIVDDISLPFVVVELFSTFPQGCLVLEFLREESGLNWLDGMLFWPLLVGVALLITWIWSRLSSGGSDLLWSGWMVVVWTYVQTPDGLAFIGWVTRLPLVLINCGWSWELVLVDWRGLLFGTEVYIVSGTGIYLPEPGLSCRWLERDLSLVRAVWLVAQESVKGCHSPIKLGVCAGIPVWLTWSSSKRRCRARMRVCGLRVTSPVVF